MPDATSPSDHPRHRSQDDRSADVGGEGTRPGDRPLVVERVLRLTRRVLPGAEEASVTVIGGRRAGARTVGSTSALAARLDQEQYVSGNGPCLQAAASGAPVVVPDTAHDNSFPEFSTEASRLGIAASLSVALPGDPGAAASLNLYSRQSDGFDATDVALAELLATEAALALSDDDLIDQLSAEVEHMRAAMASRATIEMAKGVVMAQLHCGPDAAFAELRRRSSAAGRKLRDVADDVVRACSD